MWEQEAARKAKTTTKERIANVFFIVYGFNFCCYNAENRNNVYCYEIFFQVAFSYSVKKSVFSKCPVIDFRCIFDSKVGEMGRKSIVGQNHIFTSVLEKYAYKCKYNYKQ